MGYSCLAALQLCQTPGLDLHIILGPREHVAECSNDEGNGADLGSGIGAFEGLWEWQRPQISFFVPPGG